MSSQFVFLRVFCSLSFLDSYNSKYTVSLMFRSSPSLLLHTSQAYSEGNIGVDVSEADQIDYNIWFAGVVHERGMKVGLKNCIELTHVLTDYFDFAVNESCFQWDECEVSKPTEPVAYLRG